jgi:hypothetical protein
MSLHTFKRLDPNSVAHAGSSNAAAGGANASAAGQKTTVSAADGGSSSSASSSKNSASASAAVTAAAAAVGNLVTLPSLAVTPATAIVQPVLPAPLQTAFTGKSRGRCCHAALHLGKLGKIIYSKGPLLLRFSYLV